MNKSKRVLICNSFTLFREGIKALLRGRSSFEIVGEAVTGKRAVELAKRLSPDVVLIDVVLPDLSGYEATCRIKQANPRTSVIVLTMYDDPALVRRCMEAGAAGCIPRKAQLAAAINRLYRAGEYRLRRAA